MAIDGTKKSLKGLKPIEAGFVRYFEMIETAFKNVESSMGNLKVPDPNMRKTTNTRRSPNRPVYMDNPNTPFGGNRYG